jgi:hypothetical protein
MNVDMATMLPQPSRRSRDLLIPAVLVLLAAGTVRAEPYIAARMGLKCSQCHVNRTGGGKRTPYGVIFSRTQLPMRGVDGGAPFDGSLNDFISIGGNFRYDAVSRFEYTASGGERAAASHDAGTAGANLYLQIDLIRDFLSLYVDEIVAPTSLNREAFGMITTRSHGGAYLKVGQMLLPYGLRILDDAAFIRNGTGYTFNRHDDGIEIGLTPGPWLAVANLTDNRLTLLGSLTRRRVRIGGSFGRSTRAGDRFAVGGFGGTTFGPVTLLSEIDFIREGDIDRLAFLAEANCLVRPGLNARFTYEFFDRNRDVANEHDGQERFTLGVEPFLTPFLQVGLYYRINGFIPQNAPLNQDEVTARAHFFF